MYTKKVNIYNLFALNKVANILGSCGKDMSKKYGLNHWNNSWLKNYIIVCLCALKNTIYIVYDADDKAVGTFQVKKIGNCMRFQKLATNPEYAGKGVGSFCMSTIENMAKEQGCNKVCLEVYDKSQHAIDFYKHRDYVISGKSNTLKYTELLKEKAI